MQRFSRQLIAAFPAVLGQPFDAVQASGGYSGAIVWKVTSGSSCFAVRRWPRTGLTATRIRGLHRLLHHLSVSGLTFVAPPIASVSGETLITIDGFLWQMEPWLPGEASFHSSSTDQKLSSAVQALAKWHKAAIRFQPTANEAAWFGSKQMETSPAVLERLQIAEGWLRGELDVVMNGANTQSDFDSIAAKISQACKYALPMIQSELMQAQRLQVDLQPCLRDVWHDHVLFEGDEVSGIIDPSACRTECIATDLARLLGSLAGDDQSMWQTALMAYERERKLSADARSLIRVLDRSAVVLGPLTWLRRRYISNESFNEAAVLTRLQTQLERLMALRP
jgi:Ser/Thr protein kinase RdoA (MazF antagonist)